LQESESFSTFFKCGITKSETNRLPLDFTQKADRINSPTHIIPDTKIR
jgi:hypothetical protein